MEQWRDIEGLEGRYQVSDQGHVKKLAYSVRAHTVRSRTGSSRRNFSERILVPEYLKGGLRVILKGKDDTKIFYFIDRLVLDTFVGRRSGFHPHHLDNNKFNNCLDNLEWREKENYLLKPFKLIEPKKDCKYKKKLTEEEVEKAFTDMRDNDVVAKEIGVSPLCVELIKLRVIWTQYTDHLKRDMRVKSAADYEYRFPKNLELLK